jgi:predicted DNA-binding transcriptional regulator YafY
MRVSNRIDRISKILTRLSKGQYLSTPNLAAEYKVTKKIIQTDFKEYILPLFEGEKIYYDYSCRSYKAKEDFLQITLLSADELSVIAILKNRSKDRYSDPPLREKTTMLFNRFEDELSNKVYQKSAVENIDNFKREIIQIKNAISDKKIITCTYNNKKREVYPLSILNLEGYWYLVIYNSHESLIKTFHLNSIKDIKITDKRYRFDESTVKRFDNAISAYYKPYNKTTVVELFVESDVSKYLLRKPINPTQRVIKKYQDGSIDIELQITDHMEIIPTIQRYIPHIAVISPTQLKDTIKSNLEKYLSSFCLS